MNARLFRFRSSYQGESLYEHVPTGIWYVAWIGDMGTLRHRYSGAPVTTLAEAWRAERRRQRDEHVTYCERRDVVHLAHEYFPDVDGPA